MASSNIIHVVGCHAEGEVGDVIVSGVSPPPGETIWEQSRFIDQDNTLRNFVLNEPRGGVFRHVNLLVPPKHPEAQAACIIMEPADTPPMSGSNCMCVATVLLETDILPMQELITELILEAPGGLVKVRAECEGGKVKNVTIRNVPSFALSAILGGGVFGDHCSPISDTTAVSSIASGCDLLEHVKTQLPYALLGGGITVVLYILTSLLIL